MKGPLDAAMYDTGRWPDSWWRASAPAWEDPAPLDGDAKAEVAIIGGGYAGPAVANGRVFGGGMLVAPEADPHDALLDVVVMGDLSQLESTALAPHLYRGTHLGRPKVHHRRGRVAGRPARAGSVRRGAGHR